MSYKPSSKANVQRNNGKTWEILPFEEGLYAKIHMDRVIQTFFKGKCLMKQWKTWETSTFGEGLYVKMALSVKRTKILQGTMYTEPTFVKG